MPIHHPFRRLRKWPSLSGWAAGLFLLAGPRGPAHGEAASPSTSLQILSATVKDKVIDGAQVLFQKAGASSVSGTTDARGRISVPRPFGGLDDASVTMIVKKPG